jgi:hypothetical protein
MDPFLDIDNGPDRNLSTADELGNPPQRVTDFILPLSVAAWVYFGALQPWIVIRPFGGARRTYNLTDVPGGIGVLATSIALCLGGCLIAVWKTRPGLTVMSISASSLGWMATISGLLLGVVGSLIPSIEVAGIDLTEAQVGQGAGVAVSICAALLLGILTLRRYEPIASLSPAFGIRLMPMISIVLLLLLGINHHASWLVLGNSETDWRADVPGDSMYGSGVILLCIYLCLGIWFLALVVKTRALTLFAATLSTLVATCCLAYSVLVWVGGKALAWLLPGSVEGWASISVEGALYLSFIASVFLLIAAVLSFVPSIAGWTLRFSAVIRTQYSAIRLDVLSGLLLFFSLIVVVAVMALR